MRLGAGIGALSLVALAQPAFAVDECGVAPAGGTVTCTAAPAAGVVGNPYLGGVTYVAPTGPLTVVLNSDTAINTTGTANTGVAITSPQAVTLTGAAGSSITTNGANAVNIVTVGAPITATTGTIRTSGAANQGVVLATDTGAINLTARDTATTGATALGLSAVSTTGPITITTGTVSTTGAGANAVVATSGSGNLLVNGGTITTTGLGSNGVTAQTAGAGTATVQGGVVNTAGIGVDVATATGAAIATPTTVTTSGANSTGIRVVSTGGTARAGATSVNTSGATAAGIIASGAQGATVNYGTVTTTGAGSTGILVQPSLTAAVTGTGALSTTGAGADGINATATNGTTVTATTVNATGLGSRGIVAVGGTGVNVTATGVNGNANGVVATSATGPATVTLSGTNTSAAGSGAVITAGTTSNLSLAANGTLNGAVNGATITSGTSTVVTNAGTIGGTNAALVIGGGAATVNNSGTLNGRVELTGANDTVNNSGTFNANASSLFGAGTDVFNNTGTLRVLPNAVPVGTVTLTGLETFNNSGSVDLRNGRAGDVLVLPGTYTGTGAASLGLDVSLATPVTSDRLQIAGAATGSTVIGINRTDTGPVVLTTTGGTTLVQAGAGTSATAFVIDPANVDQGLLQYGIVYNPTTTSFVLVTTPGAAVYRTALFAQGTRNLWLQSGDAWSAHMRELRDNVAANGPGGAGGRVWFQGYGQSERRQTGQAVSFNGITSQVNLGYDQDYYGFQIGMDLGAPVDDTGGFNFGITGGYQNSEMRFPNTADRIKFNVVNGGVYASFAAGPVFVNALGKYDYYWGDNYSLAGNYGQDVSGSVYGGKVEAGLRFGTSMFVEPSVSVSYTHSDFDNFAVPSGTFNFDDAEGVRGKAGARFGYVTDIGAAKVTFYGGGNYVREFRGRDRASFTSGGQTVSYANVRNRDYGEGTLGVNIGSEQGMISGFFEGRYADGGDYVGYGARGGMRFRF